MNDLGVNLKISHTHNTHTHTERERERHIQRERERERYIQLYSPALAHILKLQSQLKGSNIFEEVYKRGCDNTRGHACRMRIG